MINEPVPFTVTAPFTINVFPELIVTLTPVFTTTEQASIQY